jgi:hypothetical protein
MDAETDDDILKAFFQLRHNHEQLSQNYRALEVI